MLARFASYGFLKNQRYFEPFLVLLLLDQGVSFTGLGVLLAVRHGCRTLAEIPTGALADLEGRRVVMVASMAAYLLAFGLLAYGRWIGLMALAMALMGLGDALRSGTHKAMILEWLRAQGRASDRVEVYGYTRSWSKLGSAVGVVVGTALVLWDGSYTLALWLAMVPTGLNLVNLATYPAEVDIPPTDRRSLREYIRPVLDVARGLRTQPRQRRVLGESVAFDLTQEPLTDWLQPLVLAAAVALPMLLGLDDVRRTAVLIGIVYLLLHLSSAAASRRAHRLSDLSGGEEAASRLLWRIRLGLLAGLTLALVAGWHSAALVLTVLLVVMHSAWRPLLVSRLDGCSDPATGATLFSVESQSRALAVAMLAPVLGAALDVLNAGAGPDAWTLWPVGAVGLAVAGVAVLLRPSKTGA